MRKCGDCTLCCKLLAVPDLGKPAHSWCVHCTKTSCSIYEDRPNDCRNFSCLWLLSEDIPDFMFPKISKVVLMPSADGQGMDVHCEQQQVPTKKVARFLSAASGRAPVVVRTKELIMKLGSAA